MIERKPFTAIFRENEDESLTTLVSISINGTTFPSGHNISVEAITGGVNFHTWRYNDIAVEDRNGVFFVSGFFRPAPPETPTAPSSPSVSDEVL